MKAIILAAGSGTRLGRYTKNLPKCMLNLNGKTLIERQVETLRKTGIEDIIIIKGYMAEKIQIPHVKYYINTDYENTNMVETLFKAESEMSDEIIVSYSDIIYEPRIIEKLLKTNVDIGVTVDEDYWEYWNSRLDKPEDDVESLIIDDNGKIIELGDPNASYEKAKYRYVGLIKFSKKGVNILKNIYHENKQKYFDSNEPWLQSQSFKKAYMTCMLQAIINKGYRVDPVIIKNGWLEFDTVEDYEKTMSWIKNGALKRFINL